MSKWYGSINNRIEENQMYCEEIKVGTYATEYMWSDRHAYEVVEVFDQNHVVIRQLIATRVDHNGMSECQDYEYAQNPNGSLEEIKKGRNGQWRRVLNYTAEMVIERAERYKKMLKEHPEGYFNKTDMLEIIKWIKRGEKGKPVSELGSKINISFGVADEYYDFSF